MGSLHKRPGSKWWRYQYTDAGGRTRTLTLKGITSLKAAKLIAKKIDAGVADEVYGLVDPVAKKFVREGKRPITELVDEWRKQEVATGGNTAQHAAEYHSLVTRLLDHAKITRLDDVTPGDIKYAIEHQPRQRGKGTLSARTKNKTLVAVQAFGHWCRRNGRWRANLLEDMTGWNEETDRRHQRVAYTPDEQRAILHATRTGPTRNGMTGEVRALFYETMAGTGFRESTTLGLRPRDIDATPSDPCIVVIPTNVKNRKRKVQPITPELAEKLAAFIKGMDLSARIFRPHSMRQVIEAWREDLEAAGLSYEVDETHRRDLHSWRNTYLTHIGLGGNLKVAQDLAGHSTPALTAKYMRPGMRDYRDALQHLPRSDVRKSVSNQPRRDATA